MCASGQARSWKDAWRSVLPEAYQEGWAVQYIYAGHAIIAPSRSKKHSTGGTK